MTMGSLEPRTARERLREIAYLLVVIGLVSPPVGLFLAHVEDLPAGRFWMTMAGALGVTALAFAGWFHFDRAPVLGQRRRNVFWLAIGCFLLADAGLIACVLASITRAVRAMGT